MSYNRYGNQRPYNQGPVQAAGPNVKRFLTGTYSTLATGNSGNIAMNVPIDAANGRCIQIWSWEIEFDSMAWIVGDNLTLSAVLARTAGTGERYVNDPDVIAKIKLHSEIVGAVVSMSLVPQTFDKDFYPAVPFFGSQIHVTVTNGTGGNITAYTKVWYTDLFMNMSQMVASLQSQVI